MKTTKLRLEVLEGRSLLSASPLGEFGLGTDVAPESVINWHKQTAGMQDTEKGVTGMFAAQMPESEAIIVKRWEKISVPMTEGTEAYGKQNKLQEIRASFDEAATIVGHTTISNPSATGGDGGSGGLLFGNGGQGGDGARDAVFSTHYQAAADDAASQLGSSMGF